LHPAWKELWTVSLATTHVSVTALTRSGWDILPYQTHEKNENKTKQHQIYNSKVLIPPPYKNQTNNNNNNNKTSKIKPQETKVVLRFFRTCRILGD
jgi:carboxypeptidase C (cathepsin A)